VLSIKTVERATKEMTLRRFQGEAIQEQELCIQQPVCAQHNLKTE